MIREYHFLLIGTLALSLAAGLAACRAEYNLAIVGESVIAPEQPTPVILPTSLLEELGIGGNPLHFPAFHPASISIGSSSPSLTGEVSTTSTSALGASSILYYDGILFTVELSSNRVTGRFGIPTSSHSPADFVLGQPNLTSDAPGVSDSRMSAPISVSAHRGKLFVVDSDNNRVLIWNKIPTENTPADVVVGQPGLFSGGTLPTAANTLLSPRHAFGVDGKLIVTDTLNSRVLIFNSIPTSNNASADIVLGQPNFTTGSIPSTSRTTLLYPKAVWSDGTRLVVADSANHRVLFWNTFPTQSQAPPDFVWGQDENFTTKTARSGISGISGVQAIASNGTQLFISETRRILIWDQFPKSKYDLPKTVLGQEDFIKDITSSDGAYQIESQFESRQIFVDNKRLFVPDFYNNRFLIFTLE